MARCLYDKKLQLFPSCLRSAAGCLFTFINLTLALEFLAITHHRLTERTKINEAAHENNDIYSPSVVSSSFLTCHRFSPLRSMYITS